MSTPIDRRGFLGTTLAAGAAVAVSQGVARADDAARPLTIGVMGLSRGRSLCSTFSKQDGVKLKYVCDIDESRLNGAAESLESELGYKPQAIADFREMLKDDDLDIFVCAAPNHWHAPATIMACNAGKHVYVEKPCSHNPWEGETMVQAARKHKRVVQMGTQRRSSSAFQEAMRLLQEEQIIGRVYLARAWYNNLRPSIGHGKPAEPPEVLDYDLWQGPAPRQPFLDNTLHYNWHWRWHCGNGELGNNGVHSLDICRWGLGVSFPNRVTSSGGRYRWDDDQETPDTQTVCYEFDGEMQITWEGLSCNKHKIETGFVAFYGEEGTMTIDASGNYVAYDRSEKVIKDEKGKMDDADHINNFLDAVRENKPESLNAEIEIGHTSTLLCHLGNIAQRTGHTINVDSSNGHIIDDADAQKLWKREYEPGWEPKIT